MPSPPPPPALLPMTTLLVRVAPVVNLGATGEGERRFVPLGGGSAEAPELSDSVIEGGVDWQTLRADGVLEIAAHYALRCPDGAIVEITSQGLRHGPPEVMARLARGEPVPPDAYFFRTAMRFRTGAAAWLHLNRVMAIGVGERHADAVRLEVFRLT